MSALARACALLGVSADDDLAAIKRAWRRAARDVHPDVNPTDPDAAARFRELHDAFRLLSAAADHRNDELPPEPGPARPAPPPSARRVWAARPAQGEALRVRLAISHLEAARGATVTVRVSRMEACLRCGGAGFERGMGMRCPECAGRDPRCRLCDGAGTIPGPECRSCHGDGVVPVAGRVAVPVPSGARDGDILRLSGQGSAGWRRRPAGDLWVRLAVDPNPLQLDQGDPTG